MQTAFIFTDKEAKFLHYFCKEGANTILIDGVANWKILARFINRLEHQIDLARIEEEES